jgi:hypothetical protein
MLGRLEIMSGTTPGGRKSSDGGGGVGGIGRLVTGSGVIGRGTLAGGRIPMGGIISSPSRAIARRCCK